MRPEDLLETIGEAKDEFIQEADTPAPKRKKTPIIPIIGALAACLCLAAVGWDYLPFRSASESAPAEADMAEINLESQVTNNAETIFDEGNLVGSNTYESYSLASPVYPESVAMPLYEDFFSDSLMMAEPSEESSASEKEVNKELDAANDAYNQAWSEYYNAIRSQNTVKLTESQKEAIISFAMNTTPLLTKGDSHENLAYSPLSFYYALTMLAETVDGTAQDSLLSLVGVEEKELPDTLSKLWKVFYFDNGVSRSQIANSIWVNEGVPLNQKTLDQLAQDAYASSFQVEMGTNEANRAIAGWLNDQTGDLLTEFTEGIQTKPDTWMMLYSTIYYYDQWTSEFVQAQNTFDIFTCGDKSEVEAEYMHKSDISGFVRTDRYQFSSLGLKNSTATFVLPAEGITPEELLEDEELWSYLFDDDASSEVRQYGIVNWALPKFDISSQLDLEDPLRQLSLSQLFDGSADFSPLTEETLLISSITQSARILADEKGLSAAAYTELTFAGSGMPQDECDMILDRPFILIIEENSVPVFIGIVNTP